LHVVATRTEDFIILVCTALIELQGVMDGHRNRSDRQTFRREALRAVRVKIEKNERQRWMRGSAKMW